MPYADPKKRKEYDIKNADKIKAYQKEYRLTYVRNKETGRAYYEKNKEVISTKGKERYHKNLERNRAYGRDYHFKNSVAISTRNKLRIKNERSEIYRLEDDKCKCCGETDPIYFQIDHVNNDGCVSRRTKKGARKSKRVTLETYLANPKNYQLLCANCNTAKHLNGGKLYKPKKKKKR